MSIDEKDDLTSLHDLGEFEHLEDPETEDYFSSKEDQEKKEGDLEEEFTFQEPDFGDLEASENLSDTEDSNQEEDVFNEKTQEIQIPSEFHLDSQEDEGEDEALDPSYQESSFEFSQDYTDSEDSIQNDLHEDFDEGSDQDLESSFVDHSQEDFLNETTPSDIEKEEAPFSSPSPPPALKLTPLDHSLSYKVSSEGNPPFSLLITGFSHPLTHKPFLDILRKYHLLQKQEESQAQQRLERGSYLIPRLSEFAAIKIVQDIKKLPLNIKVGPSEKVFQSQYYEDEFPQGTPVVENFRTNFEKSFQHSLLSLNSISLTELSHFPGFETIKTMGPISISYHTLVELEQIDMVVEELKKKLKEKALNLQANGILSFKLEMRNVEGKKEIHCRGEAVWIKISKKNTKFSL